MISAKDEFFLERENIQELNRLIDRSDLSSEERESIKLYLITEQEFYQLKNMLSDRELSPLEAARRGMTMSAKQINQAVKKAANG